MWNQLKRKWGTFDNLGPERISSKLGKLNFIEGQRRHFLTLTTTCGQNHRFIPSVARLGQLWTQLLNRRCGNFMKEFEFSNFDLRLCQASLSTFYTPKWIKIKFFCVFKAPRSKHFVILFLETLKIVFILIKLEIKNDKLLFYKIKRRLLSTNLRSSGLWDNSIRRIWQITGKEFFSFNSNLFKSLMLQ